jgi:hypothetical protein
VRGWLTGIGLVAAATVVPARPSDYLVTFWVLSHQRGYRARALPATVLQVAGAQPVSARVVGVVAVLVLGAVLALLVHLGAAAHRRQPGWPTAVLAVLLVGAPVTVRHLAFELASLDALLVLGALASLVVLLGGVSPPRLAATAVLATLSVLIHEGSVLLTLPLVLAAVVVACDGTWPRRLVVVACVAAGPALALAWLQAAPVVPRGEALERLAAVHAASDVDPDDRAVLWPILNHTRTLGRSIEYTAERVAERGHRDHAVALLAVLPPLGAAALVGRRWLDPARRRLQVALWAGVVVAPVLMAPLGHDWGRWLAFAGFNGLVATIWSAARPATVEQGTGEVQGHVATPPGPSGSLHAAAALVAVSLLIPTLARGGGLRTQVGEPIRLLRLLTGL